ncbi:hypothetical protein I552_7811 [Mycobacterium xenopi 3993]|nr:hypothetical protein I552_7811 [Mycobacterium xenopi 3993]
MPHEPDGADAVGWSSGITPLPWKVLATGIPSSSANRIKAVLASLRAAPCPASTTGRCALRKTSTAR